MRSRDTIHSTPGAPAPVESNRFNGSKCDAGRQLDRSRIECSVTIEVDTDYVTGAIVIYRNTSSLGESVRVTTNRIDTCLFDIGAKLSNCP